MRLAVENIEETKTKGMVDMSNNRISDMDKITINVIKLYCELIKSGIQYEYFNNNLTQKILMGKFNISHYMWRKWYNTIRLEEEFKDFMEGDF